jgi:hypothetical protein
MNSIRLTQRVTTLPPANGDCRRVSRYAAFLEYLPVDCRAAAIHSPAFFDAYTD